MGRTDELALLTATLATVQAGRPATVLLGGEAGVGKTRLAEELMAAARSAGALVATGVCVPIDGGLAYGAIIGILRDLARQLGDSSLTGPLVALTAGPAPDTRHLGDPTGTYSAVPNVTDEIGKTRLFESILGGLLALAERSPVVWLLDDLHWADSATAELLSFLTRNLADGPVLLLGTYRSDEVAGDRERRAWLRELARHPRVTQLHLEGLARAEMTELVEGIVGGRAGRELVESVWARSQGNPFFAEELTAARDEPALPVELRSVILGRVEALSEPAQRLLRSVAAVGATAGHRLLEAVTDLDPVALEQVLEEAVDRHVLVVDDRQAGYRFRHDLLREVVHAGLLPGERARLHRAIATALTVDPSLSDAGPGHLAAALAAHWWEAGECGRALDASVIAAEAASAVWAFPQALDHLERALSALDRLGPGGTPPSVDRRSVLEKVADVAYLVGEGARSVDAAREAIALVDATADPGTAAHLYALLGRNAWAVGDSDAAFEAYRRAAALVPADPPSVVLARVMAEEARGLMLMSRFGAAEARGGEALAIAMAVGARREEGHIRYTLGCARACLGRAEEGIELVLEALAIAEEIGSPDDLNRAYMGLSALLLATDRLEESAALVFDSAALGEELWGVRLNGAASNSVEALVRLGRLDEAEALLAETGERGVGTCVTTPTLLRACVAMRRGRYDDAERALALADELSGRLDDLQVRGVFHLLRAELALWQGRPDDAFGAVEQALALAAGSDDDLFTLQVCGLAVRCLAEQFLAARDRGTRFDVDKARLLAAGFTHEADVLVARWAARAEPPLRALAFRSLAAAERSRLHESDPEAWAEAADVWLAVREPFPVAYCRWRHAEALLAGRARRSDAADSLQQAFLGAARMQAAPLREEIERLAQRARIVLGDVDTGEVPPDSTVADDLGLTRREAEVLSHLAAGRTDREIAESLFISRKTASVHVSNILRKLDVPNRVEAGRVGQAHGLG